MGFFESLLFGFDSFITWMGQLHFFGISVLNIAYMGLFFTLFYSFVLSPILGHRSGESMSGYGSDTVKNTKRNKK